MKRFLVLWCMIAVPFFMISCKNDAGNTQSQMLTGVFTKEEIVLDENFTPNGSLTTEGNFMYLMGTTMTDEGNTSSVAVLNMEDMTISYDILPDDTYENLAVSNGNYLLTSSCFDEMTFQNIYTMHSVMDGSVLWEKSVHDIITLPDYYWGQIYLASMENDWYVGGSTSLAKLSQDGMVIQLENFPSDITGMAKDAEGVLHIWGNDYHKIMENTGEWIDAPHWTMANNSEYFFGGGYDYYYKNENGLIGYAMDTSESTEVLNWVNSGLISSGIRDMVIVSPETIYMYGNDGIGGKTGLWKYTKADDVVLTDVEIIRVTYNEDGRNKIPLAAVKFNAAQSQYRIVCEEFSSAYTGSDLMDSFDKAILAGNIGDIVVTQDFDTYRKYGEKGVYADLYTLMNNELSEGDIFGCVRCACEMDGKLYGLPQEFSLDTYAIKQGCIDLETWNLEAFITLSDSLTTGKSILLSMTQEDVYNALRDSILAECIDFENHTCSFDSDIFIHFLEYIDSLPQENTAEMDWNENNYINGKVALFNSNINSYASYYQMKSVFGEEADADIVGYPSSEGGASKLSANAFYSITEESKVKEGAMAFLRYLLSADCVIDEMRGMRSIPSLKTTAKAWDDSESKMYYYFYYDHVGRWSANSKPITKEDEGVPSICIQLTQEKIDAVYDFLDHVNVYPYIPSDIAAILDEEMYVFLDTTKTAGEIAKIIQSRVSTYLSERE